jgi:acetyl-CoA carboxylase biotin carboxyl carrier protein
MRSEVKQLTLWKDFLVVTKQPSARFSTSFLKELAELLKKQDLKEIEYQEGDNRVRFVKNTPRTTTHFVPTGLPQVAQAPSAASAPSPVPAGSGEAPAASAESANLQTVRSPMVGTAYLSPAPEKPPFVAVGSKVAAGDTLLIIEAMKVMNPLKTPKGGIVKKIVVSDAAPVEYDEALIDIEVA